MNSKEIIKLLEKKNYIIRKEEHEPLMNMEDAKLINIDGDVAKNLLLVDENKNYYLISMKGDKRVSLKSIALLVGTKKLSFAKEEDMKRVLKVDSGCLTPLALLNDKKKQVSMYLDDKFKNKTIAVHPLINTCTVWMNSRDLIELLSDSDIRVNYICMEKVL